MGKKLFINIGFTLLEIVSSALGIFSLGYLTAIIFQIDLRISLKDQTGIFGVFLFCSVIIIGSFVGIIFSLYLLKIILSKKQIITIVNLIGEHRPEHKYFKAHLNKLNNENN